MDSIWKKEKPLRVTQEGNEYSTFMEQEPKPEMVKQIADFFGVSAEEAREFLITERMRIRSKLNSKGTFQQEEHEA